MLVSLVQYTELLTMCKNFYFEQQLNNTVWMTMQNLIQNFINDILVL